MSYSYIKTHIEQEQVGIITFDRPQQLNALSDPLIDEVLQVLTDFDKDKNIGCMLLTGSKKAFAAGVDIGAMADYGFSDVYKDNYISRNWDHIGRIRKPIIAAVSGYALGGGCELAMLCDIIIAADNAKFGQPEIKLGILPGAGGTQRLPRAIGKAKAMEMALTGKMIDAQEAERYGLVSRVVPVDELMNESIKTAIQICSYSQIATMAVKESINKAFEGGLNDGMHFERRLFHALFATKDQKEGMSAFLEKRDPEFKNS
jgi:enoyl-CoA hydratase